MSIRFTKMHGLGNDFIVIDAIHQSITLTPEHIASLAKRDTGVGFDQCLLIEASVEEGVDFFYRIYNADGTEVGQCGNGARCLARYAAHYGLTNKRTIRVATQTTRMTLCINLDDTVTVDMGKPLLHPSEIPLTSTQQQILYVLPLEDDLTCEVHAVSMGNPHAVSLVTNTETINVPSLGKRISEHTLFPLQANAGFMQIINPKRVRLRVYERGAAETQACGSGAAAAVAVGRLYHDLAETVIVEMLGGELFVHWPNTDGPLFLTGPATFVYEGTLMAPL